jgi:fatty-acyl-CoA synthase
MTSWITADPIALHARSQPDRLACVDLKTDRHWSYAGFDQAIQCAISVFTEEYRVKKGERIAVLARNSADLLIAQQAAMRIGAIFVPINWRLSPVEQKAILVDCGPTLLLHDTPFADELGLPSDCHAVSVAAFAQSVAAATASPRYPLPPHDTPSIILYTSGTSGRPKGVVITEENALATAVNFGILGWVNNRSVFLCDSPMFHIIGLITSLRPPLLQGGTVLISSGFDPSITNSRLADLMLGVTHYFCVPQMARMLRDDSNFDPGRWNTLTALFTGGAPNPAADILWWLEQGVRMVDGFGMTEAGTVLGMPLESAAISRNAGSAGLAAPTVSIRIVDETGAEVSIGEPGELWLKGPNITSGYWNNPEQTAKAFTPGGWFRTGDIARQNSDGFVTFVDRLKDMFITGGENVYPIEVEAALKGHPSILEVAVIGIPDERWGEVGRAFLVLRQGHNLDPEDLASFCSSRIARYKVPKQFDVIDALPRTASGKILKHVLRARGTELL